MVHVSWNDAQAFCRFSIASMALRVGYVQCALHPFWLTMSSSFQMGWQEVAKRGRVGGGLQVVCFCVYDGFIVVVIY